MSGQLITNIGVMVILSELFSYELTVDRKLVLFKSVNWLKIGLNTLKSLILSSIDPDALINLAKDHIPSSETHHHFSVANLLTRHRQIWNFQMTPAYHILMDKSANMFKKENHDNEPEEKLEVLKIRQWESLPSVATSLWEGSLKSQPDRVLIPMSRVELEKKPYLGQLIRSNPMFHASGEKLLSIMKIILPFCGAPKFI